MTAQVWSDDLLLSVPKIDREHREILDQATEFRAAVDAGIPKDVLERSLAAFVGAVERHFASEEQLIRASAYPCYEGHRAEHTRLLEQLQAVREQLASGKIQPGGVLAVFLKVWVEQHITLADRHFSEFLEKTAQMALAQ